MKKLAISISLLLLMSGHGEAAGCITLSKDLSLGSKNSDVYVLQDFLVEKGLLTTSPTGYFGDLTKKAVMAYQDSVYVPDSGEVSKLTMKAIMLESCSGKPLTKLVTFGNNYLATNSIQVSASCVDLPSNLYKGDENDDVLKLQNFLVKKGLLTAVPNSYYGVGTTQAVKDYQEMKDLKQSGNTLDMMREEIKNETCVYQDIASSETSQTIYPEGCSSSSGFSVVTGLACSTQITLPDGCTDTSSFSVTTGLACSNSAPLSQVTSSLPSTVIEGLALQITPNSPGLPFRQNLTHVKLATIVMNSSSPYSLTSLGLNLVSQKLATSTLYNFTITDLNQDKVINGGPLFSLINQNVIPEQSKKFEIYADIGPLFMGIEGDIDITGLVSAKNSVGVVTEVTIPKFTVMVSNQ